MRRGWWRWRRRHGCRFLADARRAVKTAPEGATRHKVRRRGLGAGEVECLTMAGVVADLTPCPRQLLPLEGRARVVAAMGAPPSRPAATRCTLQLAPRSWRRSHAPGVARAVFPPPRAGEGGVRRTWVVATCAAVSVALAGTQGCRGLCSSRRSADTTSGWSSTCALYVCVRAFAACQHHAGERGGWLS